MPSFSVEISDEDYAIVEWAASRTPDLTADTYLQQQFQAAVIQPARFQKQAADAPVPVGDITMAYVNADTAKQEQVRDILGVEVSAPPPILEPPA